MTGQGMEMAESLQSVVKTTVEDFTDAYPIDVGRVTAYFVNDTLKSANELNDALVAGKLTRSEIAEPIKLTLEAAADKARRTGERRITVAIARDAAYEVIEARLKCPWPFILC